MILYKAISRTGVEDRHTKFILSVDTYSIDHFNPFLHLTKGIQGEKSNLMVFGLYQRWFRKPNKDFCEKSFFGFTSGKT